MNHTALLLLLSSFAVLDAAEGVSFTLFSGPGFAGPATVATVPAVNAAWPTPPFPESEKAFSAIWQGTITTRFPEAYTLVLQTRGHFRLLLDGVQVLAGSSEGAATSSVSFGAAGLRTRAFRLEYSDWDGVGACSLLWRSVKEGSAAVSIPSSQLTTLDTVVATIPAASPVSPACVPFERPYRAAVQVTGVDRAQVQEIDSCSGWADIPLSPAGAVQVGLEGAGGTLAGSIAWTPTEIDAGGTLLIRRDDALLLASRQAGDLVLRRPDGRTIRQPITPGTPLPQGFAQAGLWTVEVQDAAQAVLAASTIQVADIALPDRMACEVGFLRTIRSPAYPEIGIKATASRPNLATVAAASATAAGRCSYTLLPLNRGEQSLVYRLPSGAILAACPLDAYTMSTNIYTGNYVFRRDALGYGHGTFRLSSNPRLDYQTITIDFFVPTMRIDGLSQITFPGSDLAADGSWTRDFVVSPKQSKSCHRLLVTQEMPDLLPVPPAAVARMVPELVGRGNLP